MGGGEGRLVEPENLYAEQLEGCKLLHRLETLALRGLSIAKNPKRSKNTVEPIIDVMSEWTFVRGI